MKTQAAAMSKDSESIENVMKIMHPESPIYMHEKTKLERLFPASDANISLIEFNFVGISGDYAVARVKSKVEKISGIASIKDHVYEGIYVFKQDRSQWKIWESVLLDKEYL